MVDIHIQAHADGVGGNEKIDLARLVKRHLRIAGPGRERAHDHSGTAALAADQFRDGIDTVGGEGHDRRTAGQSGQFLRAIVTEFRKSLAMDKFRLRQKPPDQGRCDGGAEEEGFKPASRMQQALGEDMAALRIGHQLDLIDRKKLNLAAQGHGFDSADEIDRARR